MKHLYKTLKLIFPLKSLFLVGICLIALTHLKAQNCGVSMIDSVFAPTGNVQTFVIPDGVTSINVTARGADGGKNQPNTQGGSGATATGTDLPVTPGDAFSVIVGEVGGSTPDGSGGNGGGGGGGGSFVFMGTDSILVAAGGGGAGRTIGLGGNGEPLTGTGSGVGGGNQYRHPMAGFVGNAGGGGAGFFSDGGDGAGPAGGQGGMNPPTATGGAGGVGLGSGGGGGFGGGAGGGAASIVPSGTTPLFIPGAGGGGGGFRGGMGGSIIEFTNPNDLGGEGGEGGFSFVVDDFATKNFLAGTNGGGTQSDGIVTISYKIINDVIPPNAVCNSFDVPLSAAGTATVTATQVDGVSMDNCGIVPPYFSVATNGDTIRTLDFDCQDIGNNTITLFVTDATGNVSTCEAMLNVTDPNGNCMSIDFEFQVDVIPNNGQTETCNCQTQCVTVTVLDNMGNPLSGEALELVVERGGLPLLLQDFPQTDSNGKATTCFENTDQIAGGVEVTVRCK